MSKEYRFVLARVNSLEFCSHSKCHSCTDAHFVVRPSKSFTMISVSTGSLLSVKAEVISTDWTADLLKELELTVTNKSTDVEMRTMFRKINLGQNQNVFRDKPNNLYFFLMSVF